MPVVHIPAEPEGPDPSRFRSSSANVAESDGLREVWRLLSLAHGEVVKLRSAIALADVGFDYVFNRNNRPHDGLLGVQLFADYRRHWPSIAANSAILTLSHFKDILKHLDQEIKTSPIRVRFAGNSSVTDAIVAFERSFPQMKATRDASAHSGQISAEASKNAHKAALSKGPIRKPKGASLTIGDSFDGRTFMTTRRGELLRFDVTWESYEALFVLYDAMVEGLSASLVDPQQA